MEKQQRTKKLKQVFDTVSGGYDGAALRFFPASAREMTALLGLKGDEHVLDIACGTGHAALALAQALPRGRVTAVDFSCGMLEQARRKASSRGIANIGFLERDMTALGFPEHSFDAATCAFGIFFVDDMEAQLAHIASVVKPGGRVMITNFQENYFHPQRDMMVNTLAQFPVQFPPQTWKQIATEAGCRDLFERAGLADIRVETRNVGYFLESADQWWDVIWNAGFRGLINQLKPEDQVRFKEAHLREVATLRTEKGIWLDVGVLYTSGRKR